MARPDRAQYAAAMARSAWGTSTLTAFGTAAVTATAQLGVAYGLVMIDWRTDVAGLWPTNMAWTTWLAAVSTILGALASTIVAGTRGAAQTVAIRLSAVLAAGVGAAIIAPLVALPARGGGRAAVSGTPFLAVGIGIVTGMALALIAMAARPVAWSLYASTVLVWLLALLSVMVSVGDKSLPTQLGVWGSWAEVTGALGKRGFAVAPPLIIGSIVIGIVVAWVARGDGRGHRVAAASAVAGPLLVTIAYLVAGPGTGTTIDSVSAFLIGPYSAMAGLIASLVVATMRKDRDEPGAARTPVTEPAEEGAYPLTRRDDDDTVYERIPATRANVDPYADEYTKALDEVDGGAYGGDPAKPQPARPGEDVPAFTVPPASKEREEDGPTVAVAPPPPAPPKDETVDWLSDLKDTNPGAGKDADPEPPAAEEKEPPTVKKRFRRKS